MLWLNAMILGSSLQQHTSSKRIGPCASRTEFGSMWNILVEMTPWWPQRGVLVMKPCMMYVKSKKIYAYLQQKCKEHTRTPSRHSVQVNKHVNLSGSSVLQKLIGWQLLWCCVDKLPSLRRVLLAAYHGAVANWGSGGSWQVQGQSGISVWIWLNQNTLHQPGATWGKIIEPQAVGLLAKGLPRRNFLGVRSVQSGRLIWICFWTACTTPRYLRHS